MAFGFQSYHDFEAAGCQGCHKAGGWGIGITQAKLPTKVDVLMIQLFFLNHWKPLLNVQRSEKVDFDDYCQCSDF